MKQEKLQEQVVHFLRRLRAEGIRVNQSDTLVALSALESVDLLDKRAFYYALRCATCFSPDDYVRFDRVFRGYWEEETAYAGKEQRVESEDGETSLASPDQSPDVVELDWAGELQDVLPERGENKEAALPDHVEEELARAGKRATYSADEQLVAKQLFPGVFHHDRAMDRELRKLLALLKQSLAPCRLRNGNRDIHVQKTLRRNLQYGGSEFFQLYRKGRDRERHQLLVTLADISGSMEDSFKTYLPMLHQLHRYAGKAEICLFNTSIIPVTNYFSLRFHQVVERLNQHLRLLSNGTNLAQSLREFRLRYGGCLSPQMTTVLIVSDGWDRGDMERLDREFALLRKKVNQIIWLNPLLGTNGYAPLTQALEVARPYLNHMVSVYDYKSLQVMKRSRGGFVWSW